MTDGIAISAQGLSRRFGNKLAVNAISLTVPRAQVFGFLGPNGSGKSTTIRMLCGLLQPSAGHCRVLGFDMPRQAAQVRHQLGYMTQKFSLWDELTVLENLQFMGRIYSLPAAVLGRRIEEWLKRYRLSALQQQRAGTLSGGQRQRLALAAVTLHQPELLLLDEPTSAVDPQSRRDFWQSLFELVDAGTTILVSTHYMDEAERCHQLVILDQGKLVAQGAPRQLIQDINVGVVQVTVEPWGATAQARNVLSGAAHIKAVAQLGHRLNVLVDTGVADPVTHVQGLLRAQSYGANVKTNVVVAEASLEEVFVAATGFATGENRS